MLLRSTVALSLALSLAWLPSLAAACSNLDRGPIPNECDKPWDSIGIDWDPKTGRDRCQWKCNPPERRVPAGKALMRGDSINVIVEAKDLLAAGCRNGLRGKLENAYRELHELTGTSPGVLTLEAGNPSSAAPGSVVPVPEDRLLAGLRDCRLRNYELIEAISGRFDREVWNFNPEFFRRLKRAKHLNRQGDTAAKPERRALSSQPPLDIERDTDALLAVFLSFFYSTRDWSPLKRTFQQLRESESVLAPRSPNAKFQLFVQALERNYRGLDLLDYLGGHGAPVDRSVSFVGALEDAQAQLPLLAAYWNRRESEPGYSIWQACADRRAFQQCVEACGRYVHGCTPPEREYRAAGEEKAPVDKPRPPDLVSPETGGDVLDQGQSAGGPPGLCDPLYVCARCTVRDCEGNWISFGPNCTVDDAVRATPSPPFVKMTDQDREHCRRDILAAQRGETSWGCTSQQIARGYSFRDGRCQP